jgi:hypothetical protein
MGADGGVGVLRGRNAGADGNGGEKDYGSGGRGGECQKKIAIQYPGACQPPAQISACKILIDLSQIKFWMIFAAQRSCV